MKTGKPKIISVSRRTDIPAFYSEWFMNRIRTGWCRVRNPYGGNFRDVSLKPEDCLALFFWTRNAEPLFRHIPGLIELGFNLVFHVTIVDYPRYIESATPETEISAHRFRELSRLTDARSVIWRYDPILCSDGLTLEYHAERFAQIAESIQGYGRRCIISFADFYGKTKRRLSDVERRTGHRFRDPPITEKLAIADAIVPIARRNGFELFTCCEDDLVRPDIRKARCIHTDYLVDKGFRLSGSYSPRPTRRQCGCMESIDIGAYDSCLFGCEYCYAVRSHDAAVDRYCKHNPDHPMLIPG
ncbi:DUF1848 domain-containing protein [bacterium]|nr:DUF1848 domain-containing protein [candidate division CSSED10-310 bacterium]